MNSLIIYLLLVIVLVTQYPLISKLTNKHCRYLVALFILMIPHLLINNPTSITIIIGVIATILFLNLTNTRMLDKTKKMIM